MADIGRSTILTIKVMANGIIENKEIIERSRFDITRGNLNTTDISRIKDLKLVQFTRNRTINHGIYIFDKKND